MNRHALAIHALVCLFAGVAATEATACGGIFDFSCNLSHGGLSPSNVARQTSQAVGDASVAKELWLNISAPPVSVWRGARPQVYTYVLAGDVGQQAVFNGTDARVLHARENLEALVREVRSFDPASTSPLIEANLFLIPALGAPSAASASYDFQLSDAYRRAFAALVVTRPELAGRLGGSGPFLIATRMPIDEVIRFSQQSNPPIGANTNVVLIDLTDAEPQSVVVFVSIFKDTIRRTDVVADARLEPLRAHIVSELVRVNAAIPFIGTAYAGVKDAGGGAKSPGAR